MTADEIYTAIKTMENGERIKLLGMLYDDYYDNRPPREVMLRIQEIMDGDDYEWE